MPYALLNSGHTVLPGYNETAYYEHLYYPNQTLCNLPFLIRFYPNPLYYEFVRPVTTSSLYPGTYYERNHCSYWPKATPARLLRL